MMTLEQYNYVWVTGLAPSITEKLTIFLRDMNNGKGHWKQILTTRNGRQLNCLSECNYLPKGQRQ